MGGFAWLFLVLVCLISRGVFSAEELAISPWPPIALHPDNPRYFLWRDKPTILITSGEHYGALLNLDFDFVRYLDTLASNGLNHTRTFSGVYREVAASFGITDNPLAPKPLQYVCPWARSKTPGYRDGGNKFDLTKWDLAYFSRLRDFMTHAQERGIVVEMNLFCTLYKDELWEVCPLNAANNVNGVGTCPREEVFTLKHKDLLDVQLAFVRKIVEQLRGFDNLYYEVCNEPYFHGVAMDWQHRVVDEIVASEKDFPKKHLISLNVANGEAKIESPHPRVSIFNFHYCVPPVVVAMNYGLARVIGENETGFRGRDDLLYRTEAWDFLLAGGALFNNLDYSFTPAHPGGTFFEYKSPGGGSADLRKQLGILKRFLDSFDFVRMKPDASLVQSVSPTLTHYALVEPGKAYAIYLHVPLPKKPEKLDSYRRADVSATVRLELPRGAYRVQWINTKTGVLDADESFEHAGGSRSISSPLFTDDIALRIVAAG
ncbi:MAG: hypothetical protein ACOX1P_16080 [Thermoguttaceae bacterium]|jgi:hypothetical protein